MDIPRVVITGGPCSGKTSGMAYLSQKLSDIGYYPVIVPEVATLLMSGGITPLGGVVSGEVFQRILLRTILHLEEQFLLVARAMSHLRPILLCDRGVMDARAYMPHEDFDRMAGEEGLTLRTMRDERYHGVLHLRTAAIGAEEFYTTANNSARTETPELARELDERTLEAWIGHPHLAIVDNEGKTFEEKKRLLFRKLCRIIGEPEPLEIERKFLTGTVDPATLPAPVARIEIEQRYLASKEKGKQLRIRKRGQHGSFTFFETVKQKVRPGVRVETERFISEREYGELSGRMESGTIPLRKSRYCFVWKDQHFELDIFESPHIRGLTFLEIELAEEGDPIALPPFLHVIKEVTNDRAFTNHALARSTLHPHPSP